MDNTTLFAGFGKKRKYKKINMLLGALLPLSLTTATLFAQESPRLVENLRHEPQSVLHPLYTVPRLHCIETP
jgi:hypothetical protein